MRGSPTITTSSSFTQSTLESLSSTSNTSTDTYVFTSVLISVAGILKR